MPTPPEKGKAYVSNVLPWESRVRIVSALVEGNSLRATSRMVDTDKNSTRDFGLRVGEGCAHLHSRLVRGVSAHVLECDERWSFIHTKEARVDPSKHPEEWGDVYTWVALDATSKLVIGYHVGKRDHVSADAFIGDLRGRLTTVPHLSTDGFVPYVEALRAWFLGCVDYGQVVKNYRTGSSRGPDHRYEPPRDPFITKTPVMGAPVTDSLCTSHIERQNLTMRHIVGRTRRLCLAFSKTLRGHRAAEALGFMAYNFVRIHSTIGCTPAMAAGLADHPWTIGEMMEAALTAEPCEAPRPVALALRPGTAAARELPNGRGFLRAIDGGKGAPFDPAPEVPTPAPVAPAAPAIEVPAVASSTTGADPRQLDLLAWRPKTMPMVQIDLLDIDPLRN